MMFAASVHLDRLTGKWGVRADDQPFHLLQRLVQILVGVPSTIPEARFSFSNVGLGGGLGCYQQLLRGQVHTQQLERPIWKP
jgi:hypothetical protein